MANVNTVNTLNGDLTLTGTQNVTVSDNGLQTITITGPDLSPLATTADLTSVSGSLQTQIDNIPAGGTWELLDSVTVPGSNDTVTISGFPHRDKLFVTYEFKGIFCNECVLRMIPNNDNTVSNSSVFKIRIFDPNTGLIGTPIDIDASGFIELTNYSNLPIKLNKRHAASDATAEGVVIGNGILTILSFKNYLLL
ncbi:hypothetical protein LCGC14_2317970 [marine sediment metagenome]|uniref:Uncharacterized protein n=1 Tax=marine sediment metagenome TaxID=412755 RepID=A0A0F9FDG3_9ZZZZ